MKLERHRTAWFSAWMCFAIAAGGAVLFAMADPAKADAFEDCIAGSTVTHTGGGILGTDDPVAIIQGCTAALPAFLNETSPGAIDAAKSLAALSLEARGDAYLATGRVDLAASDYAKALSLVDKSNYYDFYLRLALVSTIGGKQGDAVSYIEAATKLDPSDAYGAVWADIIERRNNRPSGLAKAVANIDVKSWPGPLVRLFLGQTTQAAVLVAANDPDPQTMRSQVCDANVYGGEFALRQGSKADATRLFQAAVRACPASIPEKGLAVAELKALGASP